MGRRAKEEGRDGPTAQSGLLWRGHFVASGAAFKPIADEHPASRHGTAHDQADQDATGGERKCHWVSPLTAHMIASSSAVMASDW